jgi:CheY-like chemotaxis protein/anti-sigma regulatory factor (Ser/Thr protein kinase)
MILENLPFNARQVVEDCVKAQNTKAVQKRLELIFEADAAGPFEIQGDPLRLRQIVANLLSNAVKFTEQGHIRVQMSAAAREHEKIHLQISVSDTGPGIPADKLAEIFEKFTQADGSITRRYGGTGLGLAITRRLVEMHGGTVRVDSEPGKGSTFTVNLTCDAAPAAADVKPTAEHPAQICSRNAGTPLLLVEDNVVNQKVVLAILRKKGYRIEVANDGREALARLEAPESEYRLILMDVQMPVLDGLEATRIIRRNERWAEIPIVAMTAHAMNGDRERCLAAGMDAYISKPVQPAHLVGTIERLLAHAAERAKAPGGLLQLFLQLAPERLDKLEAAAGNSDSEAFGQEARTLRAAAEELDSPQLRDCARRIEDAAACGDLAQARTDLDALKQEIRSLEALIA